MMFPWRLVRADFIEGLRADAEAAAANATGWREAAERATRVVGDALARARAAEAKVGELARRLRAAKAAGSKRGGRKNAPRAGKAAR